ncbi:hypothetical protein SAMN05216330_1154 [Bradyrhizobium sp. Ghvi]|nr:hypothetical protein SAMN05216330_1154 [Bradyrhizobium sp. Ghvi]
MFVMRPFSGFRSWLHTPMCMRSTVSLRWRYCLQNAQIWWSQLTGLPSNKCACAVPLLQNKRLRHLRRVGCGYATFAAISLRIPPRPPRLCRFAPAKTTPLPSALNCHRFRCPICANPNRRRAQVWRHGPSERAGKSPPRWPAAARGSIRRKAAEAIIPRKAKGATLAVYNGHSASSASPPILRANAAGSHICLCRQASAQIKG